MSAYFALYLFIPVLNAGVHQIPKRNIQKFLILVLVGIGILDHLIPTDDAFRLTGGNSPIWLMILYLFGAYIKKYNVKEKITRFQSLLGFFIAIALTILSKVIIRLVTVRMFGVIKYDDIWISYTSITIIFASLFLFLFFLNIRIGDTAQKAIMLLAPATLGVYLIHVHPLVFEYILKDAFVSFAHTSGLLMIVYTLAVTLIIFLLCAVIDLLRIQLFKLLRVAQLCESVNRYVARLFSKVSEE